MLDGLNFVARGNWRRAFRGSRRRGVLGYGGTAFGETPIETGFSSG